METSKTSFEEYDCDIDKDEIEESKAFFNFSIQSSKKYLRMQSMRIFLYILVVVGIFFILTSLLTSYIVTYSLVCGYPSTNTQTPLDSHLKNTTEMQMDLKDFESWLDRDSKIEEMIHTMNKNSKYLDTSNAIVTDTVRKQYEIDAKPCNCDLEFRVREYSDWKDGGNIVTIDSKFNDPDINIACTAPIAPGPSHYTTSSEKCELDMHECYTGDKYSREGRIFFPPGVYETPQTCSDMVDLYPGQFVDLALEDYDISVSKKTTRYWYERKYIGYMKDSKYEITFTLHYNTLDQAKAGSEEPARDGEWSLRLYTLGDGFTDTWDVDVSKDATDLYTTMRQTYGKNGCI